MKLSVIVPVRNGAASIGDLLDSLRAQSIEALEGGEFIAVDDASTDRTPEILATYPWLRVVRHEERRGAGAARNTGARIARGEVLLFLDADTRVLETDFLLRCVAFFARHPEYAAVSGCYHRHNASSHLFGRYLDACEAAMHARALDGPAPGSLNGCACAVRKTVFAALDGFSEDPRVVLEDPDLGCRLASAGHAHWFSGDLRVEHRQPGLWHYVKELVPRSRHYLHLIRHHGLFNPAMGGGTEALDRGWFLLGLLLTAGGIVSAGLAPVGLAVLALALWRTRTLWRLALDGGSAQFLPLALIFHLATTLALVCGTVLGLCDALCFGVRRRLIDGAVVLGYLNSLLRKDAPGQLIHFLTHRCNARCGHCFDGPQRQGIGAAHELDLPRIQKLAAGLGRLGHLSLTGGEPLLRDDVAGIVAAYYAAGVRSFGLNSNGSQPKKLAALLAELALVAPWARIVVTLSVDGVGAAHDRLRGLPGLYRKLEQSLAVLRQARQWMPQLRVHACMTLSRANVRDVGEVLAVLGPQGLDQIEFSRLRGLPSDPALRGVEAADYADAYARLAALKSRSEGLSRVFARLDQAMASIVRQPDLARPCGTCLAGKKLLVIQADGTVLPCEMLRSVRAADADRLGNFVLGRLGDHGDDLAEVLKGAQARRVTDYIRDSECRCSFECAIFATMVYRPWRLWRFFFRRSRAAAAPGPAPGRSDSAAAPARAA